jgi:signal transduction histidine kinase
MTTAAASKSDSSEAEAIPPAIAPASLLAFVMLLCVGLGFIIAFFNLVLLIYSGQVMYVITLGVCLACSAAALLGWSFARRGRVAVAAMLLNAIVAVGAVISILVSSHTLPLTLTLLTGGVLLAMPYLLPRAFLRTIGSTLCVLLLVGVIYVFKEPAGQLLLLTRLFIFLSCLLITIVFSVLVYRSSKWMHSVVGELRLSNAALREVQTGLEHMIQRRTAELMQSNKQLTREIAEREHVEQQLRVQNAFLETLHETSLGIVKRLDMQELLQSILERASALLKVDDAFLDLVDVETQRTRSSAAIGVFDVEVPQEFNSGEGLVGSVWASGKTVVVDDYATWTGRSSKAVAGDIHAAMGVPLNVDGRVFGIIGMVRTVPGHIFSQQEVNLLERFASLASIACDNAQLYETVRANEQMLEGRVALRTRELSEALAENDLLRAKAVKTAMAEERSRLARDLHDSVSQAIYGIVLGTRTLQQLVPAGVDGDAASQQLHKVAEYILSLADAALTEMRALIFELRPESLQQEGVLAAIRKQCDVMHVRYGLHIDLDLCDVEPAVPIDIKEAIYRITIEATHNIVKHANARRIHVRLSKGESSLILKVIDDGAGFDADGVGPGRLGLKTMQERAAQCGGKMTVKSARGKGTEVIVEIPLPASPPAQQA